MSFLFLQLCILSLAETCSVESSKCGLPSGIFVDFSEPRKIHLQFKSEFLLMYLNKKELNTQILFYEINEILPQC